MISVQGIHAEGYRAWGSTPGPVPLETPTPQVVARAVPSIEQIVCSYDWPCAQALAVMKCESSGNPMATNGGNLGLFQISAIHGWRVGGNLDALLDAETNVQVAHQIWREQGWGPWSCKPY